MPLGTKIVGVVFLAFALALGLIAVVQRQYLAPSFEELEREEAIRNTERVLGALARELDLLSLSASDWAYWDETYAFVDGGGQDTDYLEVNFNLSGIDTLDVNLIALYDTAGRRLVGFAVDTDTHEPLDLGALSDDALPATHPLLRLRDDTDAVEGLLATPDGIVTVAARYVLTNDQEGPPAGLLVMGRLLDDDRVADLAEQTRVDLLVEPFTGSVNDGWTRERSIAHTPPTLTTGRNALVTTTVLADLDARPVMRIALNEPRHISARGAAAMRTTMGSTALLALAVMALLLLVLNRMVVRPLHALSAHAARIGEQDDLRTRLDLRRRDEIGTLGQAFDRMTDRLADARRTLLERAFDAGRAELAAGVLHNVGNVVTPLVVRLVDTQDALRRLPAKEVRAAVAELDDDATDPERASDLRRFVTLAATELAGAVEQTGDDLEAIGRQVGHVQQILGEQEHHSRAAPVTEALDLAELLDEAVRLLSPALQRSMTIETDASLAALAPLRAPRVALQQVITNLLVNAAEAIAARGGSGRLRVHAEPRAERGRSAVELRFEDDGVGLSEHDLARVFERGFSTKGRAGSGLGLHWSASTVHALGGSIRLESAGPGTGATARLVLPMDTAAAAAGVSS